MQVSSSIWRRRRQPSPIFLPRESHGQRSLVGYSPWGHREPDATEWLTLSSSTKISMKWQCCSMHISRSNSVYVTAVSWMWCRIMYAIHVADWVAVRCWASYCCSGGSVGGGSNSGKSCFFKSFLVLSSTLWKCVAKFKSSALGHHHEWKVVYKLLVFTHDLGLIFTREQIEQLLPISLQFSNIQYRWIDNGDVISPMLFL